MTYNLLVHELNGLGRKTGVRVKDVHRLFVSREKKFERIEMKMAHGQ